ncbi:hypothetical protein FRC01_004912 [Tulasnella sp. 417]|nr:hypothetical protein FRC01_004912 [Tulasnella sp. 417]
METFQRIVGPQLADALGRPPPERSRCVVLLLPLAWQASTLTVVEGIMSSFVEGLPVSERGWVVDEELRKVSELVKEGEIQPAYGRWRFITHQYLKRRINHEEAVQSYVREALEYCRIAARLALKSACPDNQTFVDDLQTQMTEIMEEAFKLRADIQEKKVTANYDPYLPRNGTPFQSDLMEVTKGDEQYSNDTVVCTTRLGMICSRKRGRENSSDVMKEVALKPQVLTDQNLGDIIS